MERKRRRTDANDIPVPIVQRLEEFVLEPRAGDEAKVEFGDLAPDRTGVARERVPR